MSRQAMVIEYKLFRYVFLLTKTMMHSQKHLKKRLYNAYIYIYKYIYDPSKNLFARLFTNNKNR